MESASGGWVNRVGGIASQRHMLGAVVGVHRRHRLGKRLRVWVARRFEQLFSRADFDHFAQIHHHDPIADIADHVQIVADENIGEAELCFQIEQQVEDLRLDGFIKRRHCLIEDDHAGLKRECACDIDALSLPA